MGPSGATCLPADVFLSARTINKLYQRVGLVTCDRSMVFVEVLRFPPPLNLTATI